VASHRVVVVGGSFWGIAAVRHLRGDDLAVTLVDRRNFHLFQPLLYQVATGGLSAGEITSPLRALVKRRLPGRHPEAPRPDRKIPLGLRQRWPPAG
jgi:NADH dehydrogenase FAD-containing subunit